MAQNKDSVVLTAHDDSVSPKGRNIFPIMVSVLLAFILWFYVMTVESPIHEEVFRGIPVEVMLPASGELSIYSGYNATVDVTVSGKKSDLNQLSTQSFRATADASSYTQAGKYSIPVNIELPGHVNLVDKSISLLSVYLDAKATSAVPVQIKLTEYILGEGLELGGENEIEKSSNEVTLSGPKSVLDTIETALVVIPCGNVSSSVRASGNVQLLDAYGSVVNNPYVTTDVDSVDVRIPVFMTKNVDLKVEFKNKLLNDSNSDVELSPKSVKVRGAVEALSSLDEYTIYTIDEKALTSEKLNIPLSLPEGITCADGVESVEVKVNHIGTSTKSLTISDISVTNPNNLDYELAVNTVNITLRGKSDVISAIAAEDIELVIDLSELKKGAGSVTLPVIVKIAGTYSRSVYELGEYNMVVTVK